MGAGWKCDTVIPSMELIQQLGALSYIGVFIIALLANMVIPVPEEITLLTLGYLSATGAFHVVLIIPIIMLGLFLSDCVIYFFSYRGSKFIKKFYDKIFHDTDILDMSGKSLERTILFSRFLAYLRFLAPFLSGYHKFSLKRFFKLEMISLVLYVTIYIMLGYFLRNQIERMFTGINKIEHVLAVIGILLLIGVIFFLLKKYIKHHMEQNRVKKQKTQ